MKNIKSELECLSAYRRRMSVITSKIQKEFKGKYARIIKNPHKWHKVAHLRGKELIGRTVEITGFCSGYGENHFECYVMRLDMTDTLCHSFIPLKHGDFELLNVPLTGGSAE